MNERPHLSLKTVELGEPQTHGGLSIFPILGEGRGPDYLPLGVALAEGLVTVGEVGKAGRVPELAVRNRSERCVLLLDGEQLVGAKQNRVVNTTILLAPRSETVIPVSCVEQGRWHRRSRDFADGGALMPRSLRAIKSRSVHESLRAARGHRSDQGAVWAGVQAFLGVHGVSSPTASMDDAYRSRAEEMESWLASFPCQQKQRGVVVGLGGEVVAAELLSRPEVWVHVHRRVLRSYVAEALSPMSPEAASVEAASARAFLEEVAAAELEIQPAVGLGKELRLGDGPIVGCALVHEDAVIHGAFLREGETPRFKDFLL